MQSSLKIYGVKMCKIAWVMCIWDLTFSVAGLSVLIATKSSDRNWVSSNTVRSTWGAWSSALSAQKCLSGEKLTCPDCDKLFHKKVCQVRILFVQLVANVSIRTGFPATPFCPLGEHGPVLWLHQKCLSGEAWLSWLWQKFTPGHFFLSFFDQKLQFAYP
jgi:hypothetical protein